MAIIYVQRAITMTIQLGEKVKIMTPVRQCLRFPLGPRFRTDISFFNETNELYQPHYKAELYR